MAIGWGSGYNIALLVRAQNDASKELERIRKELEALKNQGKKTWGDVWGAFDKMTESAKKFGVALSWAYAAMKLKDMVKWAVNLAWRLEWLTVWFETMLGSAQEADKLLRDLANFALVTPFELTGIRENAKQLLAMWVESEKLIPNLKMLWDVSAWLWVPIERLANAFGQVVSQGKMTWQQLRQFEMAGVPILEELWQLLWKTREEVRKLSTEWKITSEIVEQWFLAMTSEGGRFYDLMKKESKTFLGTMSIAQDAIAKFWERFWKPLLDPLKWFLNEFIDTMSGIDDSTIATITGIMTWFMTAFSHTLKGVSEFVKIVAWLLQTSYNWWYKMFEWIKDNSDETIKVTTGWWEDLFYYFEVWIIWISWAFRIAFTAIGDFFSELGNKGMDIGKKLLLWRTDVAKGLRMAFSGNISGVKDILNEYKELVTDRDFSDTTDASREVRSDLEGVYQRMVKNQAEANDRLTDHSKAIRDSYNDSLELKNMKKMLDEATKDWTKSTKESTEATKKAKEAEKNLKNEIQKRVWAYVDKTEELRDSIEEQADDLRGLRQEYKDLSKEAVNALDKIDQKMWGRRSEGERSLADRAIEIEEEIKKVRDEYQKLRQDEWFSWENATEKRRELNDLRKELEFALANTSEQALAGAREWNEMNEAERIKRKMETDLKELEAEREKLAKEYEMKLENNKKEQQLVTTNLEMTMTKYKEHLDTLRGQFTAYYWMIESDTRGHIVTLTSEYDMLIEKLRQVQRMQEDTGTIGINTNISNVTPTQQTWGGGVVNNNSISFGDISINTENMKEEDIRNIMQEIVVDRVQNLSYN